MWIIRLIALIAHRMFCITSESWMCCATNRHANAVKKIMDVVSKTLSTRDIGGVLSLRWLACHFSDAFFEHEFGLEAW